MTWADLRPRFRALLRRGQADRELNNELTFHIEMETRKNVNAGMSRAEAERLARVRFGGLTQVEEECRDLGRTRLLETIWTDLRYGLRGLLRAPTFAIAVLATIALGLGVNTALFTVFNANYLRPLAVRNARALYEVFWIDRSGDAGDFSWWDYRDFLVQNPSFSEALAFHRVDLRLDGRPMSGTLVSGNYFNMLGVTPTMGRILVPSDLDAPGSAPIVVLSYSAWKNRFAGARDVVGRKILLRGHPFEVVGIAAEGFQGLGAHPADFWVPLTMAAILEPGSDVFAATPSRSLGIVGSLQEGVPLRQAQSGLTLWAQRFTASLPAPQRAFTASTVSRATRMPFNPKNAAIFSLIIVAFLVILLIACSNVTNMMLARAVSRQREIGVRLSLGASRARLIRQLLTESLLVVLPAAALGVLLSQAIIKASLWLLITTLPPGIADVMDRIPQLPPDYRVLGFGCVSALLATLSCSLAPALQCTRLDLSQAAHGNFSGDWRPSGLRNALLGGHVLVCVTMLITAGLLLCGMRGLQALDATLSTREVIKAVVHEDSRALVVDRLSRDPAFESLAAANSAPVDRKPEVLIREESGHSESTAANRVSPEYFATFSIAILRGRNFTAEEARSAAPVAVLSQSEAAQFWPHQDAVGKRLELTPASGDSGDFRAGWLTVIGVADDEASRWIANGESKAILYLPTTPKRTGAQLFLSVHGDTESTMRRIDADITASAPDALQDISSLQIRRWVAEEAYSFRVLYWTAAGLGLLALSLTLFGIYGVVSYGVSQRTREIGIRMALGATTGSVARLMVRQAMQLAVLGGLAGCALAAGLSKLLASILVMINPYDVSVFAGALILVWIACAATAYVPARRVARIDPISTLRYD